MTNSISTIGHTLFEAATADLSRLASCTRRSWRVEPSDEGWQHETTYCFVDGAQVQLTSRFASDLVLPASPGFELLVFERPGEGDPEAFDITSKVVREAIVGWHLSEDAVQAQVSPITTGDLDRGSWHRTFKGIRHPDGKVEWRSPSASIASAAAGQTRDELGYFIPFCAASEDEWIGMIRRGWAAQLAEEEAERRRSATKGQSCAACRRTHASPDDIPF